MNIKLLIVVNLIFCISIFASSNTLPLRDILTQAIDAANSQYYDKAIRLYDEAEKLYPDSYLPNSYKGDLYKKNKLYSSAIIEYEKSLIKNKKSMTVYDDLAECYSNQGNDDKAIDVYKLAFDHIYKSSELYNSLAWTYIKANRIDDCLALLQEALVTYPDLCDLLVTLGSAYYSAEQYENAKKSYLAAEYNSFKQGKSGAFRAIVKYNLSSLEHNFGHYEEAFHTANSANDYSQRSSAHVLLTELYFNMLDFDKALNEIMLAATLPPSTLYPDLLLARIYLNTNQTDKAQMIIDKLLNNSDHKWLSSFSTSLDDYYASVYNLTFELYRQKANLSYVNIQNPIKRFFIKNYYRIRCYFYKIRYANINIKIGNKQINGGSATNGLESLLNAYGCLDIMSAKSLKIVNILSQLESSTKPHIQTKYDILKSQLTYKSNPFYSKSKNRQTIESLIPKIDHKWEKTLLVDSYSYLIESSNGKQKMDYIQKLFLLCPYYIASYGYHLNTNVILPANFSNKEKSEIYKQLKRLRIHHNPNSNLCIIVNTDEINLTATVVYNNKIYNTLVKKHIDTKKSFAYKIWDCIFVKGK